MFGSERFDDRGGPETGEVQPRGDPAAVLYREKYVSLTTYRKNGNPVATPIWFAADRGGLVAFTGAQTGKARRLRANPRVTVAACTFNGKVKGTRFPGQAHILPDSERDRVMRLIRRKYRVTKLLLDAVVGVRRFVARKPQTHSVCLEITFEREPAGEGGGLGEDTAAG